MQTASTARVSDVVEWPVDPTPARVRFAGAVQLVGSMLMELASGAGAGPVSRPSSLTSPRMPQGPDQRMGLDPAFIEGSAPWMPPSWAGRQAIECFTARAVINPTGFEGRDVIVPLTGLRVMRGQAKHRLSRGRHATAQWVLELAGDRERLTVTGPWLTLAWVGHLAGWPEPSL